MEENPVPELSEIPKVNVMAAIMPIHFASRQFVTRRNIRLGLDRALEKIAGTRDFILAFRQCYPTVWDELIKLLGTTDEELTASIEGEGNTQEPLVVNEISEKQRRTMRIGLILSLVTNESPWTKPVRDTYRELNKEGFEQGVLIHETRWLQSLLAKDCEARDVFLKYVDSHRLAEIVRSLSPSNDMPDTGFKIRETVSDGVTTAGFPDTAKKLSQDLGPPRQLKPIEYEIVQWKSDEELNLSPEQVHFDQQIEHWVAEARAEAVFWKAPKILFDHLFIRLLETETNTSLFLDSKGIRRSEWISEIRNNLTVGSNPVEEPRLSKEIGDAIPEHDVKVDLLEAMRVAKEIGGTEDEIHVRIWKLFDGSSIERSFSDLMWLEKGAYKRSSKGWQLLDSIGVTEEVVQLEVQRMKGYPDPVIPSLEET